MTTKEDEQTAARDSDRDHQLSHTYTHPSSPISSHLSLIIPFQHHCISLQRFITHQITHNPPFIHLSLSVFAFALYQSVHLSPCLQALFNLLAQYSLSVCECVCVCASCRM